MYITINGIKGEKRIDLSYRIQNFNSSEEVAVVSFLIDNIQYEFPDWTIELNSRSKLVKARTYARRELIDLVERRIELTQYDEEPQIKRGNKLEGITEVVLNLDELDNNNNLEGGKPSNTLFTHYTWKWRIKIRIT